jgi:hypothetical protein
MADEYDILVRPDGTIEFVYDDVLASAFDDEILRTSRASHVEPFGQGWLADMRPSGGPVLLDTNTDNPIGKVAFKTRQAALDAERAWLREHKEL